MLPPPYEGYPSLWSYLALQMIVSDPHNLMQRAALAADM